MNTHLWWSTTSPVAASQCVDRLCGLGIGRGATRILSLHSSLDLREEVEGSFAGSVAPGDLVGSFAGRRRALQNTAGGFAAQRARGRQGSFSDVDGIVATTPGDPAAHATFVCAADARGYLEGCSSPVDADRMLHRLRVGETIILAPVSVTARDRVTGQLAPSGARVDALEGAAA